MIFTRLASAFSNYSSTDVKDGSMLSNMHQVIVMICIYIYVSLSHFVRRCL